MDLLGNGAYGCRTMMHEFLTRNRDELIRRCQGKVALRTAANAGAGPVEHGIPIFLDQIVKTLQVEQTAEPLRSLKVSGPSGGMPVLSEIGESAAHHGTELLMRGFTIDQVVHDYGNLCQAITDLAFEQNVQVGVDEFRTLNRCLDNAIAGAVTEFSYQHDTLIAASAAQALNERLGFLAHELRNQITTATLALAALKTGHVAVGGATGEILERSLIRLRGLVDRSLADVRLTAGMALQHRLISLSDFIAEVKVSAVLEAQAGQCILNMGTVDPGLAVDVDRDLLFSAVGNLLQNAFKFTEPKTEVTLNVYASANRIRIDVEDHCGGLPEHAAETMFQPFTQWGADKSGLGLGLAICRRSVEANNGHLSVRDVPGSGCIFTIDLPRHALPD